MMSHGKFYGNFVTEEKSPILDRAKLKLNVLVLRIFVHGYVHGGRIQ